MSLEPMSTEQSPPLAIVLLSAGAVKRQARLAAGRFIAAGE
jgi:hypothetical protein